MSKTITVGGSDVTSAVRQAGQIWVEAAYLGEVGIGGFDFSDEGAAGDVPALKAVTVDESAATPTRLATGYIGPSRSITRGPYRVSSDRSWDVSVVDLNTRLDDILLTGAAANRPEETDYARVTWLLSTGAMTGISAGVVPNTNTVTMDAVDYRGVAPRRVLDECAESTGKNYFVYRYDSGPLLYYDQHNGTSLTSSLQLSTVAADVDSSTVFGMIDPSLSKDASRVYSAVRYTYANGTVKVTNATTETNYRAREFAVVDNSVKTESKALAKANKWLAVAAEEAETLSCGVNLPAANVNDIRAGQRIELKAPHLGIAAFTYYRCTRRSVEPAGGSDVMYRVNLEFAPEVKATRFHGTHPDTFGGSEVDEGEETDTGGGTNDPADGSEGEAVDCCDYFDPFTDPNCVYNDGFDMDFTNGGAESGPFGSGGTVVHTFTDGATVAGDYIVASSLGYDVAPAVPSPGYTEHPISPITMDTTTLRLWYKRSAGGETTISWSHGAGAVSFGSLVVRGVDGLALVGGNVGDITLASFSNQVPRTLGVYSVALGTNPDAENVAGVWDENPATPLALSGFFVANGEPLYVEGYHIYTAAESGPVLFTARITQAVGDDPYTGNGRSMFVALYENTTNPAFPCQASPGMSVRSEWVGVGDGTTVAFSTKVPYTAGSLVVRVDAQPVTGFASLTPSTGAFSLPFAPEYDEQITADYVAAP